MPGPESPSQAPETPHADRLARGALLQQGAQIARLVGGFGVMTLLARELTLPELGTYTILLSLITYVQFVKSSVMNAAVIAVAEAGERSDRLDVIVSTAFVIYMILGILSGFLLGIAGLLVLPLLNVPSGLDDAARTGVIGLAAAVALGWPVQIFDDLLRGLQRFAAVSMLEILATALYVGGVVALILGDAPVWTLVAWSAAIPLVTGLCCLAALPALGVHLQLSRQRVDRREATRFGHVSGLLAAGGVADLATYSLDRVILAANRSPAAVGLYEGPLAAQNLVRFLNGVLTAPVVPAARAFIVQADDARLRELFTRGLRYSLAITMPFVIVLVILSGPVLVAWLGAKFEPMATEAAVLAAWWFIGVNGGIAGSLIIAAGRFRASAVISWVAAFVNVTITLVLTPTIGIWGPITAAVVSFTFALVPTLALAIRVAGSSLREMAARAWLPAYATAAIVGAGLVGLRSLIEIAGLSATLIAAAGTIAVYWALYATIWLSADERQLVARTIVRRASPTGP